MNWIFIGAVAGSLVTSAHDTKEACLGRKAILAENKIVGECFDRGPKTSSWTNLTPSDPNTVLSVCGAGYVWTNGSCK